MNARTGLCAFVLMVGLTGCSSREEQPDSELASIETYAEAEVAIERMRKQEDPDWDAISSQYEITSAIVKGVDSRWATDYDEQIRQALNRCGAGQKVKVNQQILAKGLQHVTVLAITDELNRMAESGDVARETAPRHVAAYFEGIRPTFVRRDKDFFGGKKTLEAAADMAIRRLSEADSAGLLAARRELDDVIVRTYALSVMYEIMEVEKLRDLDRDKCDVKRKEAEIFYRIIEARVKKRSPKAHEIISNMLAGNYDTMDATILDEHLRTGLGGLALR